MPQGRDHTGRLPAWNLLLLALLLGAGGFFYYECRQAGLYDRLESRSIAMARALDSLSHTVPGVRNSLCDALRGLAESAVEPLSLALYTAEGDLICLAGGAGDSSRLPLSRAVADIDRFDWMTRNGPTGPMRLLSYRLQNDEHPSRYLLIASPLEPIERALRLTATGLMAAALVVLTGAALLQRRRRRQDLEPVQRLARIMERTNPDTEPPLFQVTADQAPELQMLADNYNALMNRLAESLKRSRQFSADVTHELRTPLTILRGETELALRGRRSQEEMHQILASNLEEISRMSFLIEDLLLLSKSDLGEIPLKMEPVPLDELILELHHQTELLAAEKNIHVELDNSAPGTVLQADSLRLRQVFLNLLSNAVKYTPAEGRIDLHVVPDTRGVTVTISDSGIGIDSTHLEKIFERFYRVDKTHNRNDGGSGLGLAIVKWIVAAHGGSIDVSSVPGQGSQFSVKLPLGEHRSASLSS